MAEGDKGKAGKHFHYVYYLRYNNVHRKTLEYRKCPKRGVFHKLYRVEVKGIAKRASNVCKEAFHLLKEFVSRYE